MNKKEWIELADAYIKETKYWHELLDSKKTIAKKYKICEDFIGVDYFSGPLTETVEKILGGDFAYWCFDCDKSFDDFNKRVEHADHSHPAVRSLEELYDYATGPNGEGVGLDV